jgi:hypothetical protein
MHGALQTVTFLDCPIQLHLCFILRKCVLPNILPKPHKAKPRARRRHCLPVLWHPRCALPVDEPRGAAVLVGKDIVQEKITVDEMDIVGLVVSSGDEIREMWVCSELRRREAQVFVLVKITKTRKRLDKVVFINAEAFNIASRKAAYALVKRTAEAPKLCNPISQALADALYLILRRVSQPVPSAMDEERCSRKDGGDHEPCSVDVHGSSGNLYDVEDFGNRN